MNKKTKPEPKLPPKQDDDLREMMGELGKFMSLDAFRDSEGGKLLVSGLLDDVLGAVETLANNNAKLTHIEFVALACRMKERLDIVRALNGAKSNRIVLQRAVKELMNKIEENPE